MIIRIFLICFIFIQLVLAQNSCHTIDIKVIAPHLPFNSKVFITGNHELLGNWSPDKIQLIFDKNNTWGKSFIFPENTILEFKFTQGSWENEALSSDGTIPGNHKFIVKNDTTIIFQIDKWRDTYIQKTERNITGTYKIHEKMTFPGLKPRDVIVWLPPGYNNSEKRFPVLYMHDGQNLFDPNTSFMGIDWQVDETVDSLINSGKINPIIIVGIYNTVDRSEEYNHSDLGNVYMKFIIDTLKPFIDKNYRTLKEREDTATGGSSMGGLMSLILTWEYSHVFSKAICMSPAFKIDSIDYVTKVKSYDGNKKDIILYIDNGGVDLEKRLQPGIDEMLFLLKEKGYQINKDILWYKAEGKPHNEKAWAERFWRPLTFLFGK